MSGTAFGSIVLHVTPESTAGGPLALVKNGDRIRLDVPARKLELLVAASELKARRKKWKAPAARKLQLSMLPGTFPAWSPYQPVQIYALMDPAREVGGDLYDFFDVGDRMFVTMFLGFLDTRTGVLAYVNAGHLRPHLLHGFTEIEQIIGGPETPLAVRPGPQYQTRTVMLRPGDALFVCSDGVIEAMSAGEEFYGNERLGADLRTDCKGTPEEIVWIVKEHVDAFAGQAPKADDVAMLALRWEPARG